MTTTERPATVVGRLMPHAAELAIAAGYASREMFSRKLGIDGAVAAGLVSELVVAGVIERDLSRPGGGYRSCIAPEALGVTVAGLRTAYCPALPEPETPGRERLVADTEAVHDAHGGEGVLRGGLGVAEVHVDERAALVVRDEDAVTEDVVEAELVHDEHDGEIVQLPQRQPVDLKLRPAVRELQPWESDEEPLRPVIAPWLRDAKQRQQAAAWALKRVGYRVAYHLVRLPWPYVALHVWFAPRGLFRMLGRLHSYVNDGDAKPLRDAAKERGDDAAYQKYRIMQRQQREQRRRPVMALIVLILAAFLGLQFWAPWWLYWPVLVALVVLLGRIGQPADKPIIVPAVIPGYLRELSPGVVLRAFEAAKLSTEADPITFATPVHRDGNGWSVLIDLPFGKTAEQAISRRDDIASGLDVDERQVFLSRVRGAGGSARRVHLWTCEVDPLSVSAGPSELINLASVNFWEPWPFGKNERGDTVELCALWAAMLIGAIPRRGKTFVARLVGLAAALDPHVRLMVFDQKGSPNWTSFEHVADRIFYGDRPDPETGIHPLGALLDTANDLLAEVDRRNRVLRTLPKEICPEGKLTEELSRTKSMNMPLIVLIIDEVQRGFTNKDYKDDLETALTDLAKVGPSVGIITVCATQKPDAKSTPTGFRDQFGIRFALYVTTRDASEAVLGAGAGGEGMHAHKLSPESLGAGILRGTGDAAVNGGIVRTGLADDRDAEEICLRGRALREGAGTLQGMALEGVTVSATPVAYSVVTDLAKVFGSAERLHSDVLCSRLAESWSDRYAGWTSAQLQAALVPHDVRTGQVWAPSLEDGVPRNRKGVRRSDLFDRLAD